MGKRRGGEGLRKRRVVKEGERGGDGRGSEGVLVVGGAVAAVLEV